MLSDQVPYFILDLLQQSPVVYVRGLGRFEAIFHPAVMDIPGSRIKPPYVQPEFNEQGVEEDSLLATYIHYSIGANKGDIDNAIHTFVEQVKDHVERNDHYVIDQFGSFSKSATGGLRFTPDWDSFNLSFNGLEVIDLQPAVETPVSKPYVAEPYVPPTPVVVPEAIPPIKEEVITPVKEELISVEATSEIIRIEPRREVTIDETTSRLWWTILASALVLITVLCAYLAWDILSNRKKLADVNVVHPDTTSIVTNTPPVTDSTPVENEPVTSSDTETTTAPVEEPKQETPKQETPPKESTQQPDASFCYVVVGAFKDASNISRMEERVVSMGYEAEKIQGGSLTRVAIKTSCDKQVLQQTLNDARAKLNPEAWLY